jgi:DNA-binding NarL/FixJ family response regulator
MKKSHSILIVDDNPNLRKELRSLLAYHQEFEVGGEAADGLEAIDYVKKIHPDLVLMDISMPGVGGIEATKEIKKQWPGTKILIFTIHKSPEYQTAAFNAGADGYLNKDSSQIEMIQYIHDVLEGKQGFLQTS